jgi:hypothetical protein
MGLEAFAKGFACISIQLSRLPAFDMETMHWLVD